MGRGNARLTDQLWNSRAAGRPALTRLNPAVCNAPAASCTELQVPLGVPAWRFPAELSRFAQPRNSDLSSGLRMNGSPLEPSSSRRDNHMKRTVLGILLFAVAGAGSLVAQDRHWRQQRDTQWRRVDHGGHDSDWRRDNSRQSHSRDRCDRREGYADIRRDERELRHDRWELRQYLRGGNYRAAQREREEMRERERDLYRDRREVRRDRRDRSRDWVRYAGWGLR
jgi:hypothetical protein